MTPARRVQLDRADRLQRLGVPSHDLQRIAGHLRRRSVDIIDLSRLSAQPSQLVTDFLRETLRENQTANWAQAGDHDLASLREAAAHWYQDRFGVSLDSDHEIAVAPNAIIGLTLLCLSFVEAGDMVLLPNPGAPFYRGAVVLCGGGVVPYYLSERHEYRPQFGALQDSLVGRTRMIVVSYPHNPTTATADGRLFSDAVGLARRHQMLVVNDAALTFPATANLHPPSLLAAPHATGVGVEIGALDSNFGVCGLSIALICGNREAISAVQFLIEAGRWLPSMSTAHAATHLLLNSSQAQQKRLEALELTRHLISETTTEIGWTPLSSPTVPFMWISVPAHVGAESFCRRVLRRTGLLLAPGTDFGEHSEGFVRLVLPEDEKTAQIVCERLRRHAKLYQPRLPRHRVPLRERLRQHQRPSE